MKTKFKILINLIVYIVLISIIIFAGYKLFSIFSDYNSSKNEYNRLSTEYIKVSVSDNSDSANQNINNSENVSIKNNILDISINFEDLNKINSDIIGWIIIPDTVINYPIVQTVDNDYYLSHTFEKENSSSGCIFLDYQNNSDFSSKLNYVYGHNMKNGTMFHDLHKYIDKNFYDTHSVIYLYTPKEKIELKVIGTIVCEETDEIYQIENITYSEYLGKLNEKRLYKTDAFCDPYKDTIIFSTCYGKTQRCFIYTQKL